jgi:hypothetical protein
LYPTGRGHVAASGAGAALKTIVYGVANRLGLAPRRYRSHVPAMRIDADAPGGVAPLGDATIP